MIFFTINYENNIIDVFIDGKLVGSKKNVPPYFENDIIIAPPSALRDSWSRKFKDKISCQASGWFSIKQRVKQNQIEIPLVVSDHSDWTELTKTIINSNAERIWVTHGNEEGLVYWIKKRGLDAQPLSIQGRGEDKD